MKEIGKYLIPEGATLRFAHLEKFSLDFSTPPPQKKKKNLIKYFNGLKLILFINPFSCIIPSSHQNVKHDQFKVV